MAKRNSMDTIKVKVELEGVEIIKKEMDEIIKKLKDLKDTVSSMRIIIK
jgi:DNA-directed RNA polymerase subunit L